MLRPADKISARGGNVSREDSLLAGGGKAVRSKTRTPAKKASVGNLPTLKTLPFLGEEAEKIPRPDAEQWGAGREANVGDGWKFERVNDGGCVIYPL